MEIGRSTYTSQTLPSVEHAAQPPATLAPLLTDLPGISGATGVDKKTGNAFLLLANFGNPAWKLGGVIKAAATLTTKPAPAALKWMSKLAGATAVVAIDSQARQRVRNVAGFAISSAGTALAGGKTVKDLVKFPVRQLPAVAKSLAKLSSAVASAGVKSMNRLSRAVGAKSIDRQVRDHFFSTVGAVKSTVG